MSAIDTSCQQAFGLASDACRNGVVNARGYDRQGWPIGGHLTQHAMGIIASARWMLADLGVPWEETVVVLPEREDA